GYTLTHSHTRFRLSIKCRMQPALSASRFAALVHFGSTFPGRRRCASGVAKLWRARKPTTTSPSSHVDCLFVLHSVPKIGAVASVSMLGAIIHQIQFAPHMLHPFGARRENSSFNWQQFDFPI